MRILHWTESFLTGGGLGVFTHHLAAAQRERGDAVMVLVNSREEWRPRREYRQGIEIRKISFGQAVLDNDLGRIARLVREAATLREEFQPDIIHVHADGFMPWLHLLTPKVSPAATVVTLHTPRRHSALPAPLLHRLLDSADKVVAVSEATRTEWCAHHAGLADKTLVILNGVPLPHEPATPPSFDPVTLLCLGRLDPAKGFDVALRAFAVVAPHWPDVRLVIAGDGPARAALQQLAGQLGLDARVVFRGWVPHPQVAATINEATLMLIPSLWPEPFGLVAVEAAGLGRPVIASRVGGLPEIVVEGETGLLVPPDDPVALGGAISSLLRQPERIRRMGLAARERAAGGFSMARCAADYHRLCRGLTGAPSSS